MSRKRTNQHYGRFRFPGKQEVATRVAYLLTNGAFDAALDVLHTCDNPRCVNPRHLFLGNAKVNGEDMVAKGRSPCGEKNGSAKLTEATVRAIYEASGHASLQSVANRFGVTFKAVCNIKYGYRWNCVTNFPRRRKPD